MTKEDALEILDELGNSPNMVKHALACGFVMRALHERLVTSGSPYDWEIVGLLHDADYEFTDKLLDRHTEETTKKLKEKNVDQSIIDAIRGHCDKAPRQTLMAKAIYAADELTGLIVAAALVQPDKKLQSVTVESVMRKFKDKSFAAGANRDQIKTCESELKIPMEEFVSMVLKSMHDHASELGF